jgi:antitoxin HicB
MTKLEDFPFTVRPLAAADGGGYLCEFPDVPGCMGDAETIEDAIRDGRAALWSCIEALRDLDRPIPAPSTPEAQRFSGRWLMRVPKGLHQRLAEQAKAEGVSLNTLAATLLAEGLGYRQAKRRIGVAAK